MFAARAGARQVRWWRPAPSSGHRGRTLRGGRAGAGRKGKSSCPVEQVIGIDAATIATQARANVAENGLSDRITIIKYDEAPA